MAKFTIKVFDDDGAAVTGGAANTTLKMLRLVDELHFDFNDTTFKGSPTTLNSAMTEVDATNWAGGYTLTINISGFDDGLYQLLAKYDDGGGLVRNFSSEILIENGVLIDEHVANLSFTSANVNANIEAIDTDTTAPLNMKDAALTIVRGTVDTGSFSPTATQFEADDITEATADHYNGRIVLWLTGSLAKQATDITDYAKVGSNGRFTVTAMTEAPGNDDTFVIV